MSLEAINWVLNSAPDLPPNLVATLLGLANHADPSGRGAAPSQARMAHYTRKAERSVRRDLVELERLGLIRPGDQRRVAYLPPDRRPIVWDLALDRARPIPEHLDVHAEPRSGMSTAGYAQPVDNAQDREDTSVPPPTQPGGRQRPSGGTRTSPRARHRGDAHVRRTVLEEEVTPSAPLDAARALLAALGDPWNPGQQAIEQLAPAVAVALAAGWPADRLRERLAANPEGVRAPMAVLRSRVGDIPPPPRQRTHPKPVSKQRPPEPDWCGDCQLPKRMKPSTLHPGKWVKCPACHPETAAMATERL